MAEFRDVIKSFNKICNHYDCKTCSYDKNCPLAKEKACTMDYITNHPSRFEKLVYEAAKSINE